LTPRFRDFAGLVNRHAVYLFDVPVVVGGRDATVVDDAVAIIVSSLSPAAVAELRQQDANVWTHCSLERSVSEALS